MSHSKLIKSALGAAFLAATCLASPVYALEPKQCLSMTDMNAALRAEGQRTMIIGDREALVNPKFDANGRLMVAEDILHFVNTVTSNDDGSLGYQLEGDKPRAESSTQVCVRAKLNHVRLFDARRPGIPQAAFLGGRFDDALRADEKLGTRPMLIADTVHEGGRIGLPVVMTGNTSLRAGYLITRRPDGLAQHLMQMSDTDYTAAALSRLKPQVAVNEPR